MTGFSRLLSISNRSFIQQTPKSQLFASTCNNSSKLVLNNAKANNILFTQTRASHGRQLYIRPGKFYTKKFFDIVVSGINNIKYIVLAMKQN